MTPAAALAILGLERDASKAQVKQAYRDLAKIWHPDRFQDDPRVLAKAEATFKQVNEAYDALKGHPPSVRSTSASVHKARRPRARREATATPPPRPEQAEGTPPPPRTPPPDPRSTRRPEQQRRPAPPRPTPHLIFAGIVIWGIGVLFGIVLVLTLLSQACSESSLAW